MDLTLLGSFGVTLAKWLVTVPLIGFYFNPGGRVPASENIRLERYEWQPAFDAVNTQADKNLMAPTDKVPFFHVRPAPKFAGVYLWDSAFIAVMWKHRNLTVSKDVLKSVLHFQKADGRVPHVVSSWAEGSMSQPPLLSWAAVEVNKMGTDLPFLKEIYPKLKKYHQWLFKARRFPNGLFFWLHPYESGIDNSPRFGTRDESRFVDTRRTASVDLTSYMVIDTESLKRIASDIAQNMVEGPQKAAYDADIAQYETEINEMKREAQAYLWDEQTGYFLDRNMENDEFIRIPTIASFMPIFAGIANKEQFIRLREHLMNPEEFNTPIPFPTVARNEKSFEKDCWRGPVWINTAYMVLQGLKRYQDKAGVEYLGSRLVDGVYKTWKNTQTFVEFYDPERYDFTELTRKKGTGLFKFFSGSHDPLKFMEHLVAKQMYLGQKPVGGFIGWTGLVNNIVIEDLQPSNELQQISGEKVPDKSL
ncbi:MAG: trehalase family glycosidase [Bdellovibrionota bacterium]